MDNAFERALPTVNVNNGSYTFTESSLFKIILIIIIVAVLGFNIFFFLNEITEFLADIFRPIFKFFAELFGFTLSETSKVTVKNTAKGTKTGVDLASGALLSGIKATEDTSSSLFEQKERYNNDDNEENNYVIDRKRDVAGDKMKESKQQMQYVQNNTNKSMYTEDIDGNPFNNSKKNTHGWCFVGEDRQQRTCVKVENANQCMSGDIFPTLDVCVNPNLRS